MTNQQLLEIIKKNIVIIGDAIIAESKKRPLGEELGSMGASGQKTKVGDDFAEVIIKQMVTNVVEQGYVENAVLISEETGLVVAGDRFAKEGVFFVVDPIDGSNNLRSWKSPAPCVSISIAAGHLDSVQNGNDFSSIEVGVVYDVFNHRLYTSIKGEPSLVVDFGEIATSPETHIKDTIIGFDLDRQGEDFLKLYELQRKVLTECKCCRRLGSSILDFMKVASGEYDAFLSLGGRMGFYDIAAAKMIVENAGGIFETISETAPANVIQQIIEKNDISLLESSRYRVVTAGNKTLFQIIKKLLVN